MSEPGGETRVAAAALLRGALRGDGRPAGPRLLVLGGGGAGRSVAIADGLTLGRGPEAALRVADAGVSRLHARVRLLGDGAPAVEDLGSKNGLLVNGRRIGAGAVALGPGDELLMGTTTLRLIDPSAELVGGGGTGGVGPAPGGGPAASPGASPAGRFAPPPDRALAAAGLLLLAAAVALCDAAWGSW